MSVRDTTTRFFRSTGAATLSQVWRVGVTFLVMLVLRRHIPSEDFGLWAWLLVAFQVLGAIRDLGLVYHVIRVKPRPYGNLLAVELGWGAALVAVAVAGAPLLALGFSEPHPDTVTAIRVFALFLFLEGLASVPRVYFDAELQVGRTVAPELVRNILFAGLSLALALFNFGIWSLIVAQIAATAYYAAHLWKRAWPTMPLNWTSGSTWALLRQSLPLATIWALSILTRYVDPLILARRFDPDTVGQYDFAYFIAFLVTLTLLPAIHRVLYPALVAYSDDPRRMFESYRLATVLVLCVETPLAFLLFLNSEKIPLILGGRQWVDTPGLLKILCFAPLIDPFSRLGGEVLKVFNRDRLWILSLVTTLLCFTVAGWWLSGRLGPSGMAWANYLQLGGLLMAWGLYDIARDRFSSLLKDILWVYLPPVPVFFLAAIAAPAGTWPRLAVSIVAALLVALFYWYRFGASFRHFFGLDAAPVDASTAGDEAHENR